jgi:predicted amidophosphoribosyltransferase
MNATSIFLVLLIALLTILLAHWMRRLKPQLSGFQSQRMCPSCGLITSRLKARCLKCGKPLSVVVLDFKEMNSDSFLRILLLGRPRHEKHQICCESEPWYSRP